MKKGLIMEGGAMRGMFTAGVIDLMMEQGIEFDGAIGVSAGAAFGCNYKSRQIGRVIRYNTRFSQDKRYGGFRVLLKEGNFYSTKFCYEDVPLKYDPFDYDTFERNPMEFFIVCTDVDTGRAVYHKYESRHDHGLDWIRASASMPLVSQMVEIDGRRYLDGALADSIPVRYFESIGYDRNIVILTQPRGFRKKPDKLLSLMKLRYRKFPRLVEAIVTRHRQYNASLDHIARREAAGELLVIRPPEKLPIERTEKDPAKLRQVYEIGRRTAEARMEEIRKYLAE
ncbi:MAG: patatin family protein [Oscillospiraceae bacterium]|nr:patatin family protein [Oscillospiraceae bacterium]